MSGSTRFDRYLGLARSLATYHAIPFRQRRLRRLYSAFIRAGDLVFDVGAHAGNRTRALAALGCRVVAVEPQPQFANVLRRLFADSREIEVVEAAVADAPGRAQLWLSERTPAVATLANGWRESRERESDFARVRWNRRVQVEVTTLDRLIRQFGVPAFIKIDVEGSERAVLASLTHAVPALSFEYLPGALDQVEACLERLSVVGPYRFNWSPGESYRLESTEWLNPKELLGSLRAPGGQRRSGDVYAVLETGRQQSATGK